MLSAEAELQDQRVFIMKKVFLDVGGFDGDSARAALDPRFGFDAVYSFEPVKDCARRIAVNVRDRRLTVIPAGLFDRTASLPLGSPGELGGSVYAQDARAEICDFISASEWFKNNIESSDKVWIKLNCEGAELNILNDLLDSGEASKVHEALIDLDAAKYFELHDAAQALLDRLPSAPFEYHFPPEVQFGSVTNYGGIRQWLSLTGAVSGSRLASAIYNIPLALDRRFNGYHKIRLLRLLRLKPQPRLAAVNLRETWSPLHQLRGPLEQ